MLDFKGELASVCGPMRAHLGKVFTIDATSPRSARFNPLLAVRTGPEIVTDAQALAHMLVNPDLHVTSGTRSGTTPPRSSPPPSSSRPGSRASRRSGTSTRCCTT